MTSKTYITNYSPFGVHLQNRNFTSEGYRYGFNGMEKDDEIKGSGNSYDYVNRFYDNRLGRFLSVDGLAKSYPWYIPYQFAVNKPIIAIDLDGLEEFLIIFSENENEIKKEAVRNQKDGQFQDVEKGTVQYMYSDGTKSEIMLLSKLSDPAEIRAVNSMVNDYNKYKELVPGVIKNKIINIYAVFISRTPKIKKQNSKNIQDNANSSLNNTGTGGQSNDGARTENHIIQDIEFKDNDDVLMSGKKELQDIVKQAKEKYDKDPENFILKINIGTDFDFTKVPGAKVGSGKDGQRTKYTYKSFPELLKGRGIKIAAEFVKAGIPLDKIQPGKVSTDSKIVSIDF